MTDLRERFENFGDVEAPDLWDRIEGLAMVKATPPRRKLNPLAAAMAAAVVVLAVLGGGFMLLRDGGSTAPVADQPGPSIPPTLAPDVVPAPEPTAVTVPEGPAVTPVTGLPGVIDEDPPVTPVPDPGPTKPAGFAGVSNNALGTGPSVFVGRDGSIGAFVESGLVVCDDTACATSHAIDLEAFSGYPAVDPLVLADGSLAAVVLTEEGALELVVCSDARCTDATVSELTDAASEWNAVVGDDGRLVVLFTLPWGESPEPPGTGLVVCGDVTCSPAETQVTMLGDVPGPDPLYSHLVAADGRLAFAHRTGDAALFLATCDLDCEQMTSVEIVPPVSDDGWLDVFDLAVGADGLPVVAYGWMGEPRQLRLLHCEDWACTRSTVETVDDLRGYWQGPSLEIGHDGLPVMAYANDQSITVAKCEDASCTSAVISTPLGATPGDPSLIVDLDGNPMIAYYLEDPDPIDYEANPDIPMPERVTAWISCVDPACAVPIG
jgi:hypothetical protein